jgi:hypothetical protein
VTTDQAPPPVEAYEHEASQSRSDFVAFVAVVAFVVGVFLNGYIAYSLLDDGSDGTSGGAAPNNEAPIIVPAATVVPSPTPTVLPDRTTCEEIAGTEYRSVTEREFFLANCINQPEPTPTTDPEDLPPLDGGQSTEPTPTPES